ncbi:MAG: N-6 DNA methylase [Paludibacteraceae bacterium]|nr:N-6 DNA methylase [Paludibacteraceae bacterium]
MAGNSNLQQQKAAKEFAERWQGKGYEKGESQIFWTTLLSEVYGIEHVDTFLTFEQQVKLDNTSFIDAFIPSTHVMIEQKSIKKDLGDAIKQSDGSILTPFQQAKRYSAELPYSQRPRWIVTCNFAEFWVYDMEQPNGEPQKILLRDLEKEYYRLQFLVDEGNEHLKREMEVSVKAGNLIGMIHDLLIKQYADSGNPDTLRSLNMLCVRLVFCLYAEDAGLFGSGKTAFHDYLSPLPAHKIRKALIELFEVFDTPIEERDPYLDDELKPFPYVNGGLFADEHIEIPNFTDEIKAMLLDKASAGFDWSEISPTIFGAVFESTLNPETRRSGGMHYTSIENIHKVIDPLFLDELKAEFEQICAIDQERARRAKLDAFQDKIASLTFFDPACGSGNFLTESYVSLRRLENEIIKVRENGQAVIGDFANPIKVDIHQFYGIEINDFAVSVATTALWIAEQQMMQETEKIASFAIDPLPLKAYHNIHEGNALRLDWADVIAPEKLDYIMGNPPFVGYSLQSKEQKEDLSSIMKGFGSNIDYVAGWYLKAAQMMVINPTIRTALVSTNSITQGEQVAAIWKPLSEQYGIHFDFAYRTFRWDSEADIKAHVHCVIIGFSVRDNKSAKRIYLSDNQSIQVKNINGYLLEAPEIYVEGRTKPICEVPEMFRGCQPTDNGNFILTEEEKQSFIQQEPEAEKYIRPFMMGRDFINRKPRYCIWLVDANPQEVRKCHMIMQRVENVRNFRLQSTKAATRAKADYPMLFDEIRESDSDYIAIPKTSSERRRYIPMDYLTPDIVAGDAIRLLPNATLYHFGILTSNVHMAWMRVVCGRLKSDYSYSNTIVYNNFPWPTPTDEQKAKIEQTAQAILDARAKYPDCSLADLYDEVTMPPELRRAHQENDRAVMAAYGFSTKMTESECVAELFKMYQALTN